MAPVDDFLTWLVCPVCTGPLTREESSLVCPGGHTANIARQGYVTLLGPRGATHTADSKEMLAARFRVLASGLFEPINIALAEALVPVHSGRNPGPIVDLGVGTGYYLESALEALPDRLGIGLDNSKFAARMAARCHPRAAGAVVDIWEQLPLGDGTASVVIDVFAPRNGKEISRVLEPGGAAVVVTPAADHLEQLIGRFGMITVDPDKEARLADQMEPVGTRASSERIEWKMELFPNEVADLVAMGPSSGRLEQAELERELSCLPEKTEVTGAVNLAVWIAPE